MIRRRLGAAPVGGGPATAVYRYQEPDLISTTTEFEIGLIDVC
jgi:hypothetical protein